MGATEAAAIVTGVMSVIAAVLTVRKELEVKYKEVEVQKKEDEVRQKDSQLSEERQTRQQVQTKLEDLEATRREEERQREQRKKELLEAISAKCNAAPKLEDVHWKDDVFLNQIKWTDAVASTLRVGARLIVVTSGKGGVGKSTLALGLLEAFSRFKKTLLVDFDMHNRGLTSLLHEGGGKKATTNILSEMERFHQFYMDAHPLRQSPDGDPSGQIETSFDNLRLKFARPGTGMVLRSFSGRPVLPAGEDAPVHSTGGFFMPSSGANPNERFLSSKVFRSQFDEVYFFLKCLSYWAGNNPNSFETVILDCHGAHDHFMIGAIHAASALLVVTTPEPGAFDGTYDLLAFAKVLRQLTPGEASQFPTVLAINNNLDWQQPSVDAIKKFVQKPELDFVESVTVHSENDIRQVTNSYEFGNVAQIPSLWAASSKIYDCFEDFWSKPSKAENSNVGTPDQNISERQDHSTPEPVEPNN